MTDRNFAYHFRLDFDAKGLMPLIVAGWANLRARIFGLPYGDQALLIHCDLLDQVGGMPDLPLMEDVALARALKGRLRQLPVLATTSADKFERQGWISARCGEPDIADAVFCGR